MDEALDIMLLTAPLTLPDTFRVKLLAQRIWIREQLHMFSNLKKNLQEQIDKAEGGN